jgi:hypothetical protein
MSTGTSVVYFVMVAALRALSGGNARGVYYLEKGERGATYLAARIGVFDEGVLGMNERVVHFGLFLVFGT